MPAPNLSLNEADLHALVDGSLGSERRVVVLRRAAGSASDRDKIEAWQEQADFIRAAFRGVESEPLPALLDVRQPSGTDDFPLAQVGFAGAITRRPWRRRFIASAATVLVVAVGLTSSWIIGGMSPFSTSAANATRSEGPMSGLSDQILAQRIEDAMIAVPDQATPAGAIALPITSIPDLTSAGFTFRGADAQTEGFSSVVFRYQNAAAERIVIGVARAFDAERYAAPGFSHGAFSWRVGSNAYVIAGTVRPDRLRAIASSLRADSVEE